MYHVPLLSGWVMGGGTSCRKHVGTLAGHAYVYLLSLVICLFREPMLWDARLKGPQRPQKRKPIVCGTTPGGQLPMGEWEPLQTA